MIPQRFGVVFDRDGPVRPCGTLLGDLIRICAWCRYRPCRDLLHRCWLLLTFDPVIVVGDDDCRVVDIPHSTSVFMVHCLRCDVDDGGGKQTMKYCAPDDIDGNLPLMLLFGWWMLRGDCRCW